jgi:hypothetical protein
MSLKLEEYLKMGSADYDNYMCKKYPTIFINRHKDVCDNAMGWGFDGIHAGWYKLIDDMCHAITCVSNMSGQYIVADQVKQKFAELRFYYHYDSSIWLSKTKTNTNTITKATKLEQTWCDLIDAIVDDYVDRSSRTCEFCGEGGKKGSSGWMTVMCDKCKNK